MTDRERALELLTRIVTANDSADPGCTARECLLAMEGLGYRLTEARPAAEWKLHGTGSEPPADVLGELRRDLEAKAAAFRESEDGAA